MLRALFGCRHRKLTWPQSQRRWSVEAPVGKPWVTCLECGAEFDYDLENMQRGPEIRPSVRARVLEVER